MPSVTAISSGVRPRRRSPCMTPVETSTSTAPQLSLQRARSKPALECRFTGSSPNTYVCSCASVHPAAYRYEHMFPRNTPSPLTRRARNALTLARSFLLLEDDYDVDWEVDQDESGQGRSKNDDISDRPARERAPVHHPHRTPLRGRSARTRAGAPAQAPQACLCPVERSSTAAVRHTASIRTGRPQAARK